MDIVCGLVFCTHDDFKVLKLIDGFFSGFSGWLWRIGCYVIAKCHPNYVTHPQHCVNYSQVVSIQSASPIDHIQLQKAISQVEQHHYGGFHIWASAYWWKLNSVLIALRVIEHTEIAWVFCLHMELAEKLARLSAHLFQSGGISTIWCDDIMRQLATKWFSVSNFRNS